MDMEEKPSKYESQRRYAKAHPEIARATVKRWQAKNPEKKKLYQQRYYEKHKEELKEYNRRWRAAHPNYDKQRYLNRIKK